MAIPPQQLREPQTREYYRRLFVEADQDKNGYLDFHEFLNILRKKGYRGNETSLRIYFEKIDTSGDNRLSVTEFLDAMDLIPENEHKAALLRCNFQQFDENGDGKIDRNELDQVFLALGKVMNSEDLDRIMKEANKSGTGALNYEEFIAVICPTK